MLTPDHLLPGSPDDVDARVAAELERRGIARPATGADPDDPAVGLWWILRMAARTHRRHTKGATPVADDRIHRLQRQLARRPDRDDRHGQLHVDTASTLRRADAVYTLAQGGPVIAVGDDDAVSLALADMDLDDVCAIDIDERILSFLHEASDYDVSTREVDVLAGSVPKALLHRFAVAVTDPFRDLDGGLGFLSFAAACVAPGGAIAWVDDPDWNFEHEAVREGMEKLGWKVEAVHEDLHAYPLTPEAIELEALQKAYPDDAEALAALTEVTMGWSSLYVLRQ